jgi:hypothetical protein
MAFGTPTLYTITSKLPCTLSYKIYDIEQTGEPKLEEIVKIISKPLKGLRIWHRLHQPT